MSVFTTPPERAALHRSGWVPFINGLEITAAPLVDPAHTEPGYDFFARLTYRDALVAAKRLCGRLMSQRELDELHARGHRLRPIIQKPGVRMASLVYAQIHDETLAEQLEATNWDGKTPLDNAGKQWVGGAAPGRALNYGWWDRGAPNGVMWQSLGHEHNDQHTDYSQLTMLVREAGAGAGDGFGGLVSVLAPVGRALRSAGRLVADAFASDGAGTATSSQATFSSVLLAAAIADIGVREQGGANRGPEVDAWLRMLGVTPPANWCSAAVAKWLRDAAAALSRPAPIAGSAGAKATMAQLQAAGRWVPAAKARGAFKPGCIVVWHRDDPGSWMGHIGIGERSEGDALHTVEGNSGRTGTEVARMRRSWSDPLLLGIGLVD